MGRFIPTRVGQIASPCDCIPSPAVHPHACGADLMGRILLPFIHGSSPRVWGRSIHLLQEEAVSRFIPTRVGQITDTCFQCSASAVHPHACGADYTQLAAERSRRGSSPRAWGRLTITFMCPPPSAVHPHVRGADLHLLIDPAGDLGSSPRAWGRWLALIFPLFHPRFIPTRVGQMCGHHLPGMAPDGSSPRVWGR